MNSQKPLNNRTSGLIDLVLGEQSGKERSKILEIVDLIWSQNR